MPPAPGDDDGDDVNYAHEMLSPFGMRRARSTPAIAAAAK